MFLLTAKKQHVASSWIPGYPVTEIQTCYCVSHMYAKFDVLAPDYSTNQPMCHRPGVSSLAVFQGTHNLALFKCPLGLYIQHPIHLTPHIHTSGPRAPSRRILVTRRPRGARSPREPTTKYEYHSITNTAQRYPIDISSCLHQCGVLRYQSHVNLCSPLRSEHITV